MQQEGKILPDLSTNKQDSLAKIGISMDLSNKKGDLANDICLFCCKFMGPRNREILGFSEAPKQTSRSFIHQSLSQSQNRNKTKQKTPRILFARIYTHGYSKSIKIPCFIKYHSISKIALYRIVNSYIPVLDKAEFHSVLVGGIPTPLKI